MNETILVQELHLPSSGLSRLEEQVPIPKFIGFETTGYGSTRFNSNLVDDSYFQYHFLAQVAHRIILTRIRHSLYFYCKPLHHPTPPPKLTTPSSRLRNLSPPSNQHRTTPPTRTMAHQPPQSNPIHQHPLLLPPNPSRPTHPPLPLNLNPLPSPPLLPKTRPHRPTQTPIPSSSNRRRHAPRPPHDRALPHRPPIPLQGAPNPAPPDRRRLRASAQRPAERNELAHDTGHIPENEELHPHQIRLLFAVSTAPTPEKDVRVRLTLVVGSSARFCCFIALRIRRVCGSGRRCRRAGSAGMRRCWAFWRIVRRIVRLLRRIWNC